MASISSMKMMAGARLRASANRSRTRAAPTPTNISTKLGAGDREERHPGLAGHGPGQQRLAGAGRPDHQHAARHHRAGPRVAVGVPEEVDHLGDLGLGALVAGHVGERGRGPLLVEDLGPGPADAQRALQAAARVPRHPEPQPAEEQQRQAEDQQPAEHLGTETRPGGLRGYRHAVGLQLGQQRLVGLRRDDHRVVGPAGQRAGAGPARRGDVDGLHLVLGHVGEELGVGQARRRASSARSAGPATGRTPRSARPARRSPASGAAGAATVGAGLSPGGGGLACLLMSAPLCSPVCPLPAVR